jgi:hypothetical protein
LNMHLICICKLKGKSMFTCYQPATGVSGLAWELDPHIMPTAIVLLAAAGKLSWARMAWVYCGLDFNSCKRRIDYPYLIISDQIES